MEVHYKNIYTTKNNNNVLIVYNISNRHYLFLPLYKNKVKDGIYIPSIGFFCNVSELGECKYKDLSTLLYIKGKYLKINDKEHKNIIKEIKNFLINKINSVTTNTIDDLLYINWFYDMFKLNNTNPEDADLDKIKVRAIYWLNFGIGVGSEIRKLRPAILWRYTSDRKMCTFIPISSKCYNDIRYFHCDLEAIPYSTAKIECMQNFSYKRIYEPYLVKGKPVYINDNDFSLINSTMIKYYAYH